MTARKKALATIAAATIMFALAARTASACDEHAKADDKDAKDAKAAVAADTKDTTGGCTMPCCAKKKTAAEAKVVAPAADAKAKKTAAVAKAPEVPEAAKAEAPAGAGSNR
ncbi:MAG TPA: hypothetical protein VFV19_12940 [Candidatus Polarisedimenticolaceae bacterium]|nr:hypothetical protein [Candidatus Polarisedimenticolaceae bacterium]